MTNALDRQQEDEIQGPEKMSEMMCCASHRQVLQEKTGPAGSDSYVDCCGNIKAMEKD